MSQPISNLAVGALVSVPVNTAHQSRWGSKIVFKIADKNHAGYPANSVTLITDKIIQLMAFDGAEPTNPNTDRKSYGNNRYLHSNIAQWLNSNAGASAWYSAQHTYDAPPILPNTYSNPYDSWAGFLQLFSADFVSALMTTSLITARNINTDGGGSETVTGKFFLASNTEVGVANENNVAEGYLLAIFTSENNTRLAYPTPECVSNGDFTSSVFKTDASWSWWIRTPFYNKAQQQNMVSATGTKSSITANASSYGLRPLCNVPSTLLVSSALGGDGAYTMEFSSPQHIPFAMKPL